MINSEPTAEPNIGQKTEKIERMGSILEFTGKNKLAKVLKHV